MFKVFINCSSVGISDIFTLMLFGSFQSIFGLWKKHEIRVIVLISYWNDCDLNISLYEHFIEFDTSQA